MSVRVELPLHLMRLANLSGHETTLDVAEPATLRAVLDALEAKFPALEGMLAYHWRRMRGKTMTIIEHKQS